MTLPKVWFLRFQVLMMHKTHSTTIVPTPDATRMTGGFAANQESDDLTRAMICSMDVALRIRNTNGHCGIAHCVLGLSP